MFRVFGGNQIHVLIFRLWFHPYRRRRALSLGESVRAAGVLRPGRSQTQQGRRHDILRERRLLHHRDDHDRQGGLETKPQGTFSSWCTKGFSPIGFSLIWSL